MNQPALMRKPKRFIKKTTEHVSLKGLLLYFLPLPIIPAIVFALIRGDLKAIIVNFGCYMLYLYAAWLLRQGLSAEDKYRKKTITRPPKKPLKFYAALVTAITTGLVSWLGANNHWLMALVLSAGAMLGMYLYYGFDPRRTKNIKAGHGYSVEEISETIDEAEGLILAIEQANDDINNREFNDRIDRICSTARSILRDLEQDPGDIRRARKFLKVYLEGARKVTDGYAKTHKQTGSSELEDNFRNLLEKIEQVFSDQKEKLIENDVFDLDVQIEVLATQLKQEGII